MARAPEEDEPALDALARSLAAVVGEARDRIAGGGEPDREALAARVGAAVARAREQGGPEQAVARAERQALTRLDRVLAVHRARALVAAAPAPAAPPRVDRPGPPRRRALLRTRPTISGSLDVRRDTTAAEPTIAWKPDPKVTSWEVRFAERPDVRSDYAPLETLALDGAATSLAVPLGDRPLRVTLVGHGRDGRVVRRALISGLTRDGWGDRWQRRATAS